MNLLEYIKERELLDKLNTNAIHENYNAIREIYRKTSIEHSDLTLDSFTHCMKFVDEEIANTNKKLQDIFYKKIQPPRLKQSYKNYERTKKHKDIEIIPDDFWRDELKDLIMSKIKKNIDFQFPGCEIGPRSTFWTRDLVGMDPLFLVGPDLSPIEHVKSQFNDIYQRRIRIYQLENTNFSYLPQRAFSFVFSWHHFEFLPYDIIDQYLLGIFDILRPGGTAIISYADCLLEKPAQQFEEKHYCYMTRELMEGLANKNGFDVIEESNYQFRLSWIIIRKPGKLDRGIKHVPSIGYLKASIHEPIP